jgi:2-polyprenyl-3-methyl-5-hydroxy-6-metoxy-1,4-benzoquinol methylase
MNEGGVQSMFDVDFGMYHHSTPDESKGIRENAEKAFSKLLRSLYPSRAALKILDAGCGLGFLTYVAAKCFPKASVTGVDLFRHGNVSQLSMDKAVKNMKSLGIESRTSLKHDLTKPWGQNEVEMPAVAPVGRWRKAEVVTYQEARMER